MTETVITFIVGGGLAALLTQFGRVIRSLRSGARATTREVIQDLAAARDEAEEREAELRRDKDYWRNVAGSYGYLLRRNGITPDPVEPRSPSEARLDRERRDGKSARQRRAERAPTTEEIEEAAEQGGE